MEKQNEIPVFAIVDTETSKVLEVKITYDQALFGLKLYNKAPSIPVLDSKQHDTSRYEIKPGSLTIFWDTKGEKLNGTFTITV